VGPAWLQVNRLLVERDQRLLMQDVSFAVHAGQILQVEGPNGSGKTTLLRILSTLSEDYEGEILWHGSPLDECRWEYRNQLLFLGHRAGVKASLTPEENLKWYQSQSAGSRCSIAEALRRVGLYGYEDAPCYTLSAGQQRRVALARLHMSPAQLWILDEPFTAIDKQGVAELENLIASHAEAGGAVILTTHHNLCIQGAVQHLTLGLQAGAEYGL